MSEANTGAACGPRPNTAAESVASTRTTATHLATSRGPATAPRWATSIWATAQATTTAQSETVTTSPLISLLANATKPARKAIATNTYVPRTTKRIGDQS